MLVSTPTYPETPSAEPNGAIVKPAYRLSASIRVFRGSIVMRTLRLSGTTAFLIVLWALSSPNLPAEQNASQVGDRQATSLPTSLLDTLNLGDTASGAAHGLTADRSEVIDGLLHEPARRFLPGSPTTWDGGKLACKMAVDPNRQNYLTVRCSGDEINENYLILFCEGKQVGYRHLGDVDVLALPDESPRYNGRFYYVTTPLPRNLTQAKHEVALEIRSTGPIFGYANDFEHYQKLMTKPSRGVYRLYTHPDGFFAPPFNEKQGQGPVAAKRTEPGPEVMDQVKARVNKSVQELLNSSQPINQMQLQFLARAFIAPWTSAYQSSKALQQAVASVDELHRRWKQNPDELWRDPATWNPEWFGVGPAGDAVRWLVKPLQPALEEKCDGGLTRRQEWSAMFQASRDWLRTHRRWLTNQAMFTDTNLYLSNCAVAAIDPASALDEAKARDYLYQSAGLVPWIGSDTPAGPEKPFGDDFYQVTQKGLTRERGYAGGYGEGGVEGMMDLYGATRGLAEEGDPKLKAQLVKMVLARGPFRYPMLDGENHSAMRLETAVGWRDTHLPGNIIYAQRGGGEHSPIQIPAATLDPDSLGYVQQMFADNQFFAAVAEQLKDTRFRAITGLLDLPAEYDLVRKQPASPRRLPMSWDQPDFVFSDEEDGVVAVKNGREILYASLYWRAGYAVNSLARTHYLTPNYEQVAVVREDVQFEPSGQTYRRPDWINFGFGNGGTQIRYPADIHQASAGEELPIVKPPPDVEIKPGEESHFAGRGDFYTLQYGPYLIGMNLSKDRDYELKTPANLHSARELVAGRTLPLDGSVKVKPKSTVVLYLPPTN